MDLDKALAEARAEVMPNDVSEMAASHRRAFDAAANIAREVVAERDAQITETIEVLRMEKRDLQIQIEQMAEGL
jgi:hypothetical protein